MTNSLLDKISRSAKDGVITKWQNGQVGEIVDLQGNGVYRFIDYETDANGNVWKKHLTEESELSCPIVASGIIAYWLRFHKEKRIEDLFEGYYNRCLKAYEQAHEKDADAWSRNLNKEFTCRHHIPAEKRRIEQSKTIFAYLTDSGKEDLQEFASEYLKFVSRKRQNTLLNNYPLDRCIEESFFDIYRSNGAVCLCIDWMRKAYNLPQERPDAGTDKTEKERIPELWKEYYDKVLPETIQVEFEMLDHQFFFKDNRIMQEIRTNLKTCSTLYERKQYLGHIVESFREVANVLHPFAAIDELEQKKEALQQPIDKETTVVRSTHGGSFPMCIMTCTKTIDELQKDIEFIKKQQIRFNELAAHPEPNQICTYFSTWIDWMKFFANKLAQEADNLNIDLNEIQKNCGIYLFPHYDPIHCVDGKLMFSKEHALQLRDEIKQQKESTLSAQACVASTGNKETKTAQKTKKKEDYPPYTFNYYNSKNDSNHEKQQRVVLVFRLLTQWKWIDKDTNPDNFDHLFEGEEINCHIKWITSSVILTHFLKELRVRSYIVKQVRCSVNAIMKGQFGKNPDHNTNRISEQDKQRIDFICDLLDIHIPLKSFFPSENNKEVSPIEDLRTLVQFEVLNGNMRERKSV